MHHPRCFPTMFKPREIHNFTQGDACVSFNCLQIKKTSEEIPDKPSEREEGREEVSERDKTQLQNFTSSVNIHVESHRWILIGCLCCLTLKPSAPVVPRYLRQHLNFFFFFVMFCLRDAWWQKKYMLWV